MGVQTRLIRDWPASLSAREAVDYTGLSPVEIARAEREGRLTFKALGPHGRRVVLRTQLDELLTHLWATTRGDPLEDMDFGDD